MRQMRRRIPPPPELPIAGKRRSRASMASMAADCARVLPSCNTRPITRNATALSVATYIRGRVLTRRLSAVNLFDRIYVLRAATGVAEFAPQYGPRRDIFGEITQQFRELSPL